MQFLSVLVFLLLCSVGLGWLARRAGLPYPIALVLGGAAVGFVPGLPQLEFDPQFLLVLVLPPILYQAALLTSWRDFKANAGTIGLVRQRHRQRRCHGGHRQLRSGIARVRELQGARRARSKGPR